MKIVSKNKFRSSQVLLSPEEVELYDDSGFLSLEMRIKQMLACGEVLVEQRRQMFPHVGENYVDPDIDEVILDDMDHIEAEQFVKDFTESVQQRATSSVQNTVDNNKQVSQAENIQTSGNQSAATSQNVQNS